MTYNTTGLVNASGIDYVVALNGAASYYPVALFVFAMGFIMFVWLRQNHDGPEAMWLASLLTGLMSGGFLWVGMLSVKWTVLFSVWAALAMMMHYFRGRGRVV
jgi:hypothetical protein